MDERVLKTLEYNKIISRLAEKAQTRGGKEQLLGLLPYTSVGDVISALAQTTQAREVAVKHSYPPISAVGDVRAAVRRSTINAILGNAELLNIGHLLRVSRALLKYVDFRDFTVTYPVLNAVFCRLAPVRELENRIFEVIISEEEIDDNASATLASIRRKKTALTNRVRDILNEIIKSPAYAQVLRDPIISMRGDRYVVPVRAESRSSLPGVVHDTSQSGGTVFVEPMKVVETNNQIRQLASEEKEEIERILAELTGYVAENAQIVLENYEAVVNIDAIFAKARLADEMNASCPEINSKNIIEIRRGRHPLIDPENVVPIDIRLGGEFDTLVITGPNTGGKTVSLKTLGLFTLMAQAGLHIPAAERSKTAVFKQVFADIGDEQSIEQSLSTFSSHMVNIVKIIEKAGTGSLILFDELGAGTDPTEGAALATAILKEVRKRGATTAATTHYSEIKLYALSTEGVENAACEFDVATLRPTYRLIMGALGKSNAFAIAQRLGLGENIIESAKELMDAESVRFEDVVTSLEGARQDAEEELRQAEKYKLETERLKEDFEQTNAEIEKRRQNILDEARREAKKLISDAKEDIEIKIKEINRLAREKNQSAKSEVIEKIRRDTSKKLGRLEDELYKNAIKTGKKAVKPEQIKPGSTVYVTAMAQKGTAVNSPDQNGNLEVMVGVLKVKTHISTLELVKEEKVTLKREGGVFRSGGGGAGAPGSEVDVRGMTLDDAVMKVDKYLDDARLYNLATVNIIHGKGTGVLRSGIKKYLKTNPLVSGFRLGVLGEGGDGVTVVNLK